MRKPMTSEQATEKFQCEICRSGLGSCWWDCVLSETCSVKCPHCAQSVFFQGEYADAPVEFVCPHCGEQQTNKTIAKARALRAERDRQLAA